MAISFIFLAYSIGVILAVFFIYLLFTQPANALYYAEIIVVGIGKLLYFLVIGTYRILEALISGIRSMFRRR